MMLINRQNSVAVLLVLLLSHAALTLHCSAHVRIDQSNCDYCTGHADPGQAISRSFIEDPPLTAFNAVALADAPVAPATMFATFRQRAPPALI